MQLIWGPQGRPAMPPLSLWCPWEALGCCLQLPLPQNQRYLRYPASQAHRCAWTRGAREEDFFIFSGCTASVAVAVSSSFDCLDFFPISDLDEVSRSPFGGLSNAVKSSAGTLPQNFSRRVEPPNDLLTHTERTSPSLYLGKWDVETVGIFTLELPCDRLDHEV